MRFVQQNNSFFGCRLVFLALIAITSALVLIHRFSMPEGVLRGFSFQVRIWGKKLVLHENLNNLAIDSNPALQGFVRASARGHVCTEFHFDRQYDPNESTIQLDNVARCKITWALDNRHCKLPSSEEIKDDLSAWKRGSPRLEILSVVWDHY
ncbi:MAG: hypothetical protein JWQ71_2570 [Pedosphaera sp.]|nr:hypothetical protein [Pedosphaera sp.]